MRETFKRLKDLRRIPGLWVGLYLFKLISSMLIILPFFLLSNGAIAKSVFASSLTSYWDISVLVEMFTEHPDLVPYLLISVVSGTLLFVISMQFFNGGIYYLCVSGETNKIDWGNFFSECGRGFKYQVFVTVLMLPVYFIILISANVFANLLGLLAPDQIGTGALLIMLVKLGLILFVLLLTSVFSDSARAASAAFPDKNFRGVLKIAADYFRARFFRMAMVFLVTFIPFVIIWLIVEGMALSLAGAGIGLLAVVLEFLLFQLSAFARNGQKLWYLLNFGKDFRSRYHGRFLPRQSELQFD